MIFHLLTFAAMVTVTIIYGRDLGWKSVVVFWLVFIAGGIAISELLNSSFAAIVFKALVAAVFFGKAKTS